jgi:hypothetical protein
MLLQSDPSMRYLNSGQRSWAMSLLELSRKVDDMHLMSLHVYINRLF